MNIARIKVTDQNRESVLNYIKINHPNYVLVENYEVRNKDRVFLSEKAEAESGIKGPAVIIETDGDLSIKIRKEDYQAKGHKLIPVTILEEDTVDTFHVYNQLLRETKVIMPAEKVISFKNFEIRDGKIEPRNYKECPGDTIFIIR